MSSARHNFTFPRPMEADHDGFALILDKDHITLFRKISKIKCLIWKLFKFMYSISWLIFISYHCLYSWVLRIQFPFLCHGTICEDWWWKRNTLQNVNLWLLLPVYDIQQFTDSISKLPIFTYLPNPLISTKELFVVRIGHGEDMCCRAEKSLSYDSCGL